MKKITTGIILIVGGIILIVYTGFSYITTEKVADLGLIKITREKKHPIQWSPVIGILLIAGGAVTIFRVSKSTR